MFFQTMEANLPGFAGLFLYIYHYPRELPMQEPCGTGFHSDGAGSALPQTGSTYYTSGYKTLDCIRKRAMDPFFSGLA